jgi:hypothetical protein
VFLREKSFSNSACVAVGIMQRLLAEGRKRPALHLVGQGNMTLTPSARFPPFDNPQRLSVCHYAVFVNPWVIAVSRGCESRNRTVIAISTSLVAQMGELHPQRFEK